MRCAVQVGKAIFAAERMMIDKKYRAAHERAKLAAGLRGKRPVNRYLFRAFCGMDEPQMPPEQLAALLASEPPQLIMRSGGTEVSTLLKLLRFNQSEWGNNYLFHYWLSAMSVSARTLPSRCGRTGTSSLSCPHT